MSPSFSDLLPSLLAIVGLSLAMVFVMVRWSAAMLARPPGEETPAAPADGWSPVYRWGFAYAAVWALLIVAFLRLLKRTGSEDTGRNVLFLLGMALGWFLFNRLWIAFARAIQRANERDAARVAERSQFDEDDVAAEEDPAAEELGSAPVPAPAPTPASTIGTRIRGILRTALTVAVALVFIGIGEALPPLQRLHAWTVAHQKVLLAVTVPIGAIGFVLFMYGVMSLVLSGGRAMSREEIDESIRRQREQAMGPALWRRYKYRSYGPAAGATAEDSASFSEVKAAWRARAWRTSPRWRRMFLMLLATALLTTGLFGSIFVIAQPGIKLLLGGAYLYAVARTTIAFSRA